MEYEFLKELEQIPPATTHQSPGCLPTQKELKTKEGHRNAREHRGQHPNGLAGGSRGRLARYRQQPGLALPFHIAPLAHVLVVSFRRRR